MSQLPNKFHGHVVTSPETDYRKYMYCLALSSPISQNRHHTLFFEFSSWTIVLYFRKKSALQCSCAAYCNNGNSSSSSSSRNEYYLGGIIALLLQDHRADKAQMHNTLSDRIRKRRPEQNGLQFSVEDGKRRCVPNRIAEWGRAFQARAAATGNDRSPRVERRVDGTSRVDVSAPRRCWRVPRLETGRMVSARQWDAVPSNVQCARSKWVKYDKLHNCC